MDGRAVPADLPGRIHYIDFVQLMSEREKSLEEALAAIAVDSCREWIGHERCNAPAEFILWGRLLPSESLGPRCFDCAVKHVGYEALGDPSYAIVDLRPALRLLGR